MRRRALIAAALLAALAPAEAGAAEETMVVATRSLRAGAVVAPGDVATAPATAAGALADPGEAIGMEARVSLVKGRPVMPGDLRPPTAVERNQLVSMTFRRGPLTIVTDGRALGRGSVGERVRVMNLDSRTTVTAVVSAPGVVEIP
jgi:flagella basal body P-ring formation protein FlgA